MPVAQLPKRRPRNERRDCGCHFFGWNFLAMRPWSPQHRAVSTARLPNGRWTLWVGWPPISQKQAPGAESTCRCCWRSCGSSGSPHRGGDRRAPSATVGTAGGAVDGDDLVGQPVRPLPVRDRVGPPGVEPRGRHPHHPTRGGGWAGGGWHHRWRIPSLMFASTQGRTSPAERFPSDPSQCFGQSGSGGGSARCVAEPPLTGPSWCARTRLPGSGSSRRRQPLGINSEPG